MLGGGRAAVQRRHGLLAQGVDPFPRPAAERRQGVPQAGEIAQEPGVDHPLLAILVLHRPPHADVSGCVRGNLGHRQEHLPAELRLRPLAHLEKRRLEEFGAIEPAVVAGPNQELFQISLQPLAPALLALRPLLGL